VLNYVDNKVQPSRSINRPLIPDISTRQRASGTALR